MLRLALEGLVRTVRLMSGSFVHSLVNGIDALSRSPMTPTQSPRGVSSAAASGNKFMDRDRRAMVDAAAALAESINGREACIEDKREPHLFVVEINKAHAAEISAVSPIAARAVSSIIGIYSYVGDNLDGSMIYRMTSAAGQASNVFLFRNLLPNYVKGHPRNDKLGEWVCADGFDYDVFRARTKREPVSNVTEVWSWCPREDTFPMHFHVPSHFCAPNAGIKSTPLIQFMEEKIKSYLPRGDDGVDSVVESVVQRRCDGAGVVKGELGSANSGWQNRFIHVAAEAIQYRCNRELAKWCMEQICRCPRVFWLVRKSLRCIQSTYILFFFRNTC